MDRRRSRGRCGQGHRRGCDLGTRNDRGWLVGREAFDSRFLTGLAAFEFAIKIVAFVGRAIGNAVARPIGGQPIVVMTQALELVVRGLDVLVRNQDDLDLHSRFKFGDLGTFLIEQIGGHLDRHLGVNRGSAFLDGLFLDHAKHVQGRGFDVTDHTGTVAARAGDMRAFVQRRAQPLARQLHQSEARNLSGLHPSPVVMQRVLATLLDFALVLCAFHVDEVDDDQAAEITQAHLAGHFVGGFKVGAKRGLLDIGALGGPGRVDVDRDQRFGMVDHDRAARGQGNQSRISGLDLMLNLKAGKQRRMVAVAFDASDHVRHDMPHELLGLLADIVGVEENLSDIGGEIIADRTNHQTRFLINQKGT